MAMARMRRVCLASAVRAAAARNCEILRFWRVISIADMLPAPRINDVLHRVTLAAGWESPQESGSQAVGISHPGDLLAFLCHPAWRLERVGLEAGPLSQWLFSGLAEAGVPAICIETRHAKAFLKAQVNKSDRNDARGIAQMMRVGLFQPVHVKTLASQKRRALLAARKILQEKALAIENDIRGLLRNFGLKVGIVGVVGFEQRIHDLVEGVPELADIMEPLLAARRVLREKFAKLHRKVLLLARDNEVCQRLVTIPGVGPVVSLAFISTVDVPARFRNSKAVGPSLGLTPVLNQSGESPRVC